MDAYIYIYIYIYIYTASIVKGESGVGAHYCVGEHAMDTFRNASYIQYKYCMSKHTSQYKSSNK